MDYDTYSANDAIGKGINKRFNNMLLDFFTYCFLNVEPNLQSNNIFPIKLKIHRFSIQYFPNSDYNCFPEVYINLNPLLISHRTSHQPSSVAGTIMGVQGDQEYSGVQGDINSQSAESGLIMGAPINPLSSGVSVSDDSATITPNWFKSSSGYDCTF